MATALTVGLVEYFRTPTASIHPAEDPVPLEKSIVASEAAEVDSIDILVETLVVVDDLEVFRFFIFIRVGVFSLWFLSKLSCLFEFLAEVLLD